jgi:two-component system alkaline phosphatase synthesis response regulator PhoP
MSGTAKRILLVDDDPEFTDSTRAILASAGYEVQAVHDGTDGLARAVAERPDLMILDVMMSTDTEGFDICRRVRETRELDGMPVLMLTGIRREMNLPFGFEAGDEMLPANKVLEKPIAPATLLREVGEILTE